MTGTLAKSKAGHDKDNLYIIMKEEAEYVYLADGRLKTVENPKKKSKKHIQLIKKYDTTVISNKLFNKESVSNEEVKRAIKLADKFLEES